jgi:uncharacterized membrane-anchored protein YjiN (DUF445 family)
MRATAPGDEDPRLRQLRRMRRWAGSLLLLMLAVFVLTSILRTHWPWLIYPRAFAEAAMVGACADWFAVVSIFRHPFGLPLPHTAVIPKHKRLIGESFGRFIAENFLVPTEISARLERVDVAGLGARWLAEPEHAQLVTKRLTALQPVLLELLEESTLLRDIGSGLARQGIDSIAAAPLAARTLTALVKHGHHERILDAVLDRAARFVVEHQDEIHGRISNQSGRWVPEWVDARVTHAFLAELLDGLLKARANADHPWREEYREALNQLIAQLAHDETWYASCEEIKSAVLDHAAIDGYFDWLHTEMAERLRTEFDGRHDAFASYVGNAIGAAGRWLVGNDELRHLLNSWTRRLVLTAVVPNRDEIARFISDVVARWDTRTLIQKLEWQVGSDLQYIRINGTLVGGLVGLTIFSVARLAGW